MQVYDVIEVNMNQDGSEDSWSIGIFSNEKQANEACEKMSRSVMYNSNSYKKFYVRVKHLDKLDAEAYIPTSGYIVLKLHYMYIGSMTTDPIELNDPMHYNINFDWFLLDKAEMPVEKISVNCASAYISVIADESVRDFKKRRIEKFHEMWEEVNKIRRESGMLTLPFELH